MNQIEIEELLDKLLNRTESDIEEVFNRRLTTILQQIAQMFEKYERGGELSWTDVNKYDRFTKEMKRMASELTGDYQQIIRQLQNSYQLTYVEGYLRHAYLLEKVAGTEMGFNIPTTAAVKQILLNPIAQLTLTSVLQQHRTEIVRRLNIEISQGIIAGEGYTEIATRIRNAVGFSKNKARLVARTEGGRIRTLAGEKAEEQAAKFVDIQGLWMSALDLRVRTSHQKLDGQKTDAEGYFRYKGMKAKAPHLWGVPSMDIQCRCVKLRLVNGMMPEYRRGRDYMDSDYQKKLANRIEKFMAEESLTYKQALKKAQKEVKPSSVVREYEPFEKWKDRQPKAS